MIGRWRLHAAKLDRSAPNGKFFRTACARSPRPASHCDQRNALSRTKLEIIEFFSRSHCRCGIVGPTSKSLSEGRQHEAADLAVMCCALETKTISADSHGTRQLTDTLPIDSALILSVKFERKKCIGQLGGKVYPSTSNNSNRPALKTRFRLPSKYTSGSKSSAVSSRGHLNAFSPRTYLVPHRRMML